MADLRTEMSSFLKQGDRPVEKQVETKPDEKETDSHDEGQQEQDSKETEQETNEPEEKSEKNEPQEDSEDKDTKDDKKKPNRYQRLKSQRDEAVAEIKKHKDGFLKAVKVANAWRTEAKAFETELNKLKEQAKAKGVVRTPEQDRLFDYERQHAVRHVEEEFDKQANQDKMQDDAQAFIGALREKFSEDASEMGRKHGIQSITNSNGEVVSGTKRILKKLLEERNAGNMVSMEDVARDLKDWDDYKRRKSGDSRQLEVSRGAPRTMRPGSPAKLDYPATPKGMKDFLHSLGKD